MSPNFGFTLTWQSPWYVANVGDDPEYDSLSIVDSNSFVYFAGSDQGLSAQEVVDDFVSYVESNERYTNVQALTECATNTHPFETASACYRYDHLYDGGANLPEAALIQGFAFGDGIELTMIASVDEELFSSYLPQWAQFGIYPPGQAPFKPVAGIQTDLVQNGVTFVFDPTVSDEHRAEVMEGIRLGQDAIARYLGLTDLGDLRITVLDAADPQDPYLLAATLGESIVVYAGGDAWQAAPPIVRVETMVHELTHVYQGLLAGRGTTDIPIWFIEGTAEAIGFLAATQLGVIDQNDVYDLELYWLTTYPVSGSLGDLQSNESMSVDTYPLAYLAVQYLLGRSGLSVTAIGEVFSAIQNGASFEQAFKAAFGIAPDQFYAEFDAWRTGLQPVYEIPAEFSPSEGAARAAGASWLHAPSQATAGEQLIFTVTTVPEADCTSTVQLGNQTITRTTFANDAGKAFWIITIPPDTPAGQGTASVTCGANPIEATFAITSP